MEVNLSQRNRPESSALLPKLLPGPTLPSQFHSFYLKTWANTKRSLKNQLKAIALRWRCQLEDISKDQLSTKHHFVHVVKETETLTSISNQYGVSPYSIVMANKNILDTDPINRGQHIKIPSAIGNPQVISYQLQEKLQSSLSRLWNCRNVFTLASPLLPPVRTIGFIVLVPLIVFCVRFIIGASYARVSGTLRLKSVNKSEGEHHEFRHGHWRSALRDLRELDGLNSESNVDPVCPSEDEEQISIEDLARAYKKLDQDYRKFLSECGLSKWGYWRGGSPES